MNIKPLLCPQSSGEKKPATAAQKRKQTLKRRSYLRAVLLRLCLRVRCSGRRGAVCQQKSAEKGQKEAARYPFRGEKVAEQAALWYLDRHYYPLRPGGVRLA